MKTLVLAVLVLAGGTAEQTKYQKLKAKYDGCMEHNKAESICKTEKDAMSARGVAISNALMAKYCSGDVQAEKDAKAKYDAGAKQVDNPEFHTANDRQARVNRAFGVSGTKNASDDDMGEGAVGILLAQQAQVQCLSKLMVDRGYYNPNAPEDERHAKWYEALASGKLERELGLDK